MNDQGDIQKIAITDVFRQQQIENGMIIDILKMQRRIPQSDFSAGAHIAPEGYRPNPKGFFSHWHKVDKWTDSILLSIFPRNILEAEPAIQERMADSMGITLEASDAEGNAIFTAEKYDGAYHIESWELLTDNKGIILAMGHYYRDNKSQPEQSSWDQYDFRTNTHRIQETQSHDGGINSELTGGKTEFITEMTQAEVKGFLTQALAVITT